MTDTFYTRLIQALHVDLIWIWYIGDAQSAVQLIVAAPDEMNGYVHS